MESTGFLKALSSIKTFVFDVDGVLTDGTLYLLDGKLVRRMNVKDGYAIKVALEKNYRVAVITGGNDSGVKQRLEGLGITDIYADCRDKLAALKEIIENYDLNTEEILFMGDELIDMEAMYHIACPVCPSNAAAEVKMISSYVSPINGGDGCVRDVIEKVLKVQDQWPSFEPKV